MSRLPRTQHRLLDMTWQQWWQWTLYGRWVVLPTALFLIHYGKDISE